MTSNNYYNVVDTDDDLDLVTTSVFIVTTTIKANRLQMMASTMTTVTQTSSTLYRFVDASHFCFFFFFFWGGGGHLPLTLSHIVTFHPAKVLTHIHLAPVALPTRPAVCVIKQL